MGELVEVFLPEVQDSEMSEGVPVSLVAKEYNKVNLFVFLDLEDVIQ